MTASQSTPHGLSVGGARTLRATIIACLTNDEGACLMCADCGHMFIEPKPLSDESQPVDNVTLSKALWYHMCAIGRGQEGRGVRNGR
jgi:hypothetical protein